MIFPAGYNIQERKEYWQRERKNEMSKKSVGVHKVRNVKQGMRKYNLKWQEPLVL
jgi:hypothetical protein